MIQNNNLSMKCSDFAGGSFLASPATIPRRICFNEIFLTLKPTLSPGLASSMASWCISTDLTSVVNIAGANVTDIPGLRIPVSTRPTGTVPIPPILYTSWSGKRRGFSTGLLGGLIESRAFNTNGPLYQGIFLEGSSILSPTHPEIGINGIFLGLNPTVFKNFFISLTISWYLLLEYLTDLSSILLIKQIICLTPRVNAKRACSRVCPVLAYPASNSPTPDAMTRIATSACDVPVIIFLMKSRCPGASMIVK